MKIDVPLLYKQLTIKDELCDLTHDVYTNEYKTVRNLKQTYAVRAQRQIYKGSQLSDR